MSSIITIVPYILVEDMDKVSHKQPSMHKPNMVPLNIEKGQQGHTR
jgi:hypothetical protein